MRFVLLAILACVARASSIPVCFKTSDTRLIQQFEAALGFWSDVTTFQYHPAGAGEQCGITVRSESRNFLSGHVKYSIAITYTDTGDIYFTRDRDDHFPGETYRTCVHEIGHYLGLHHSGHDASIMAGQSSYKNVLLEKRDFLRLDKRWKVRTLITPVYVEDWIGQSIFNEDDGN